MQRRAKVGWVSIIIAGLVVAVAAPVVATDGDENHAITECWNQAGDYGGLKLFLSENSQGSGPVMCTTRTGNLGWDGDIEAGPNGVEASNEYAGIWDFGNSARSARIFLRSSGSAYGSIKVCAWDLTQGSNFLWSRQESTTPGDPNLDKAISIPVSAYDKTTSIAMGVYYDAGAPLYYTCQLLKQAAGW